MKKLAPCCLSLLLTVSIAAWSQAASSAKAANGEIKRGEYLAQFGGCNDCHTPKVMTPNGPEPDKSRLLSGHPSDDPLPAVPLRVIGPTRWGAIASNDMTAWAGPWGVSFATNLTPDPTGLDGWTEQ